MGVVRVCCAWLTIEVDDDRARTLDNVEDDHGKTRTLESTFHETQVQALLSFTRGSISYTNIYVCRLTFN